MLSIFCAIAKGLGPIPIVFYDVCECGITQHMTYWIMKDLSYDKIVGIGWLKYTYPVIDSVACSLDLTVDDDLHAVLALPVNSIASMTLSSLKQVLAEVKHSCPACFSLFHPQKLL